MIWFYFHRPLIILFALGFASGVPFLLTLSTLSFWLTEFHISKSLIGLLMMTSLPYSLKFLWSPFIEKLSVPLLSRWVSPSKSWGLLAQIMLMITIIALGQCDPGNHIVLCAFLAFVISFCSATQDIVIDAYRLSLLNKDSDQQETLGRGAAMESIGFRLGMLVSGAGTLYLAAYWGWPTAYTLTASALLVGIVALLSTPDHPPSSPVIVNVTHGYQFFRRCFQELLNQHYIVPLVSFIACFKIADTVLNAMSAPFLFELGFSKIECAQISKFFGIIMMVGGGLLGGSVIHRLGLKQTIITCAIIQTLSCLMFVVQSWVGHNMAMLTVTIGVESLCSGLATTVFIAYLSNFCKSPFTVSHFTLLYSVGSFSRVLISALSGWFADTFGWSALFFLASTACIPVVYLLLKIQKIQQEVAIFSTLRSEESISMDPKKQKRLSDALRKNLLKRKQQQGQRALKTPPLGTSSLSEKLLDNQKTAAPRAKF